MKTHPGYTDAIIHAAHLDAFRAEVMANNPEYTRGIVEVITYALVDNNDDEEDPDTIKEWVIAEGIKATAEIDAPKNPSPKH